jgi:hypothetical protein
MTAYNTCAYPGCMKRIAYEPGSGEDVEFYCDDHARIINFRGKAATQSHFMDVD